MKKVFLFAVAAAALVACSNEELSTPVNNEATSGAPVNFSVYTQRGLTRAGEPGTIDNNNIGTLGFGVFAYYTPGEQYDAKATPNFMYNQKVTKGAQATAWTYEPVKYWPNEFGSDAASDEVDRLSFFAYAPWTEVDPTTGNVFGDQKKNIISVNKNTATGDPMIKYVVDTNPATSVDLLWGVAADDAATKYSGAIQGNVTVTPGKPFIDLIKPKDPVNDLMSFNLKHALAKVRVTIDYIADAATPDGTSKEINADQTRIYVRNIKMTGFAMKGTLNLNNSEGTVGEPLWKDFDGVKDLAFDEVVFQDGRKDGKEGETNGAQTNETPQGLNPNIVENFAVITPGTAGTPAVYTQIANGDALERWETYYRDAQGGNAITIDPSTDEWNNLVSDGTYYKLTTPAVPAEPAKFGANKTTGVTKDPQLLFGGVGDPTVDGEGYFFVIPRNETSQSVDIQIAYDVETIDPALAGKISDGETHGISIENVISKAKIFGDGIDFKAGNVYDIKIHLGMTSVKISATVTDWATGQTFQVELPANQPQ